jgi:hypothetical protein
VKLWWLPPSVAISLIVSGTFLVLGSISLTPGQLAPVSDSAPAVKLFMAVIGVGLGAGMIVNGIARSTRPPEGSK